MTQTKAWWYQDGWWLLNCQLVNIAGCGVGNIPIENLVALPPQTNLEELKYLIARDGCEAKVRDGILYVVCF